MAARDEKRTLPDDGFGNAEIRAAFERAREAGLDDSVLHINGPEERACVLNNPM